MCGKMLILRGDIATGVEPGLKPPALRGYKRGEAIQNWECNNEREGVDREIAEGSGRSVGMTVGQTGGISTRVSVRNTLLSGVVRGSFDEWFKNPVRLSEVVVNDVHEE